MTLFYVGLIAGLAIGAFLGSLAMLYVCNLED